MQERDLDVLKPPMGGEGNEPNSERKRGEQKLKEKADIHESEGEEKTDEGRRKKSYLEHLSKNNIRGDIRQHQNLRKKRGMN